GGAGIGWKELRVRFDGLSGFLLAAMLAALAPAMLANSRRTGPLAGALVLLVLTDGVAAVPALALLLASAGVRRVPVLVWTVCAGASLALPAEGAPVVLAAIGLGALLAGGAEPALAIAGFYVLARVGLEWVLPVPWGLAVLGFGLFGAVLGGVRASVSGTIGDAVPAFAAVACGLGSAGLGAAMAARGADLLP